MEKTPLTSSAADHTGSAKAHSMLPPSATDEQKPVRKRPPRTLQLNIKKFEEQTAEEKPAVSPISLKVRSRSSPLIEKLQANLALTPSALLHSPKSPDVTHPPTPFSPGPSPAPGPIHSPLAPPSPALVSEEQAPVSFEDPPEGAVLPSINKGRARLSLKRRPPTRQHRKSCSEEGEGATGGASDGQRPSEGGEEEEEADGRSNRKDEGVRDRKRSGRDSGGEGGASTAGADEDRQETPAVTQEAGSAGDQAPAGPEGEEPSGEPSSGDEPRANQKEGEETRPQQKEEENAIGPDEVKIEFSVK